MNTRRKFLLSASTLPITLASITAPVRAQPTQVKKPHWDGKYDVVIIGGGGGGMSAAAEAAKKGLSVLVVEKMPMTGGSSVLCGGCFTLSETKAQKEKNIPDTNKTFFDDMVRVGGGVNDKELIKAYIAKAPEQYKYITETLKIEPYTIVAGAGMSEPRAHMFKPSQVVQAMQKDAVEHGVKILLNTRAMRLIWSPEKERIVGVECERKGKKLLFEAEKGVILTSGGFSRNKALLNKYNPLMAKADAEGGMGNTGDGLLMALAYGADTLDTNYIKATHGYRPTDPSFKKTSHTYYSGGILVDKNGKRFVNESLSYKLLGDESLKLENGISYAVFDEKARQHLIKTLPKDGNYMAELDGGKDTPWCFQGKTIEEVAKKAGVNPQNLAKTIEKYNADVEKNGKDSVFGRSSLTSGYGKLSPINHGPYFIYPVKPRLIATYCGIKINPKAQVIDVFGEPIKGLYAAGEVTGGLHGAAYMSGTAFGKAMTFGRVAAQSISKE